VNINHNIALDVDATVTTVEIASGTTFTVDADNTLTSNGGISGAGSFSVNGTWRIEAGGFTSIAPTYGSSSTLIYASGGNYGRGTEWSATSGAGYPNNVTISNNTTIDFGAGGTAVAAACGGDLTIDSGSNLFLDFGSNDMTQPLTVKGNFVNNGQFSLSNLSGGDLIVQGNFNDSGTFTANGRAVFFTGGNAQTVTSSTDPLVIDFLLIDKSANDVTMNQNLDLPNDLTLTNGNLNLNGRTLTISGDIIPTGGSVIANGTGSTLIYDSASAQTIESGDLQGDEVTNLSIDATGGVTVNTNLTVSANLTVTINGDLTVAKAASVDVSGNLTNDGTLTLESDSNEYSSLIVGGTATGNVTYNRYTAQVGATGTNDLIASPVSGQDFGPFATANSGALAASGNIRAFAPFNPVENAYTNYDTGTNANTEITPGTGYRAGTQASGGETLAFTGTPNNGSVAVTLVDNTSFWNLIGNPYPSYIDIGDFLSENVPTTNINDSFYGVYGYDGNASDGWTVWDLNVNQDLLIAPGQGFFVAAPSSGGSGIDFTTTMRRTGTSDDFIAGRNAANTNNFAHAILNLNTASTSFVTNVYFRDINTLGLDPGYDTGAYDQNANGVYTHLVEDNAGIALFNQSLPYANLTDVVVPLVVNLNPNEQITFSLNSNSVVPESIDVIIEDSVENTFTTLNSGDYTITPSTVLSGSGRFFLRFAENALSTAENELDSLFIFANANKQIVISGLLNTTSTAQVYDLQGRAVMSQTLEANVSTQTINASALTSGIYIVEVSDGILSKTQKIILR
jgi:hypothetical protein